MEDTGPWKRWAPASKMAIFGIVDFYPNTPTNFFPNEIQFSTPPHFAPKKLPAGSPTDAEFALVPVALDTSVIVIIINIVHHCSSSNNPAMQLSIHQSKKQSINQSIKQKTPPHPSIISVLLQKGTVYNTTFEREIVAH